ILRVPGTVNHKEGRNGFVVKVEECHLERRYRFADFPEEPPRDSPGASRAYSPDTKPAFTPERLTMVLEQLDATEFRDYKKWFSFMCACHEATGGLAKAEFLAWSVTDPKYANDGPEIGRKWDKLELGKAGNATVGSLIHTLIDHDVDIPPDLEQA